ncbi:hypothetical protein [Streptomyces sp. ME18-1-4]|uniref:hypothetical protein n=1 Tax=Streptomyces sp. ME18-1-4 TaxID=3028685 RepID=UPI0029BCA657|nr:hypothetical protein [Streptomyces sp. ME18-1-4]MDX3248456.1 hypothetical protein [Streptomyces sp. ME18-1-4]
MATTLSLVFVDWKSRNGNVAAGSLDGATVQIAGRLGTTILDGSAPVFNSPAFTPSLPASDMIEIVGEPENKEFTVNFLGDMVQDPVFHLGSLGSTLTFPTGTQITRLSGDTGTSGGPRDFSVVGNQVIGRAFQPPPGEPTDSSGSVRLPGRFSSIKFNVKPNFVGGSMIDGVALQIGGTALPIPFTDWKSRNGNVAAGSLDGATVQIAGRLGTTILDGSAPVFNSPAFTPSLPASDMIEIVGEPENKEFTVNFLGDMVQDPVFHLGSLGSTLTFPTGTQITRLSGDTGTSGGPRDFSVVGNQVIGRAFQPPPGEPTDSSGSVRLPGRFSSIKFNVKPNFVGGSMIDGVALQIGGIRV